AEVKFSASKRSPGYLRFLLLARIRRGALDGPNPWRRRALLSMTKRSIAIQFFCHSFAIPVSSAVLRVRMSKSMNTNTSLCRVFVSVRGLKQKLVLTYFSGFR
ncbi:MAG: hypothetical protein DME64_08530, partial [Verrucomicrobia bacterium]